MAVCSESTSSRGVTGACGEASVGSNPALPRQLLTLTARFGHVARHVETVYAASDTCLADLRRLLVRAGGCVAFPPFCCLSSRLSRASHAKGRTRSGCPDWTCEFARDAPVAIAPRTRCAARDAATLPTCQRGFSKPRARALTTPRAASSAAT